MECVCGGGGVYRGNAETQRELLSLLGVLEFGRVGLVVTQRSLGSGASPQLLHFYTSTRLISPRSPSLRDSQRFARAEGVGLGEREARTAKQPQGPERKQSRSWSRAVPCRARISSFHPVVKDRNPEGLGTCSGLGYPQRPEQHVPSPTAGKTAI